MKNYKITLFPVALFILILFHTAGVIGILFSNHQAFFISHSPLNILISTCLLIAFQEKYSKKYFIFIAMTILLGFVFEVIGVNTKILFGHYKYGSVLGFKVFSVPIIMGCLWFTTMYLVGHIMHQVKLFLLNKGGVALNYKKIIVMQLFDAALLATTFDWLIEPVAIKLGFWNWLETDGNIPSFNYFSWFACSFALQILFVFLKFDKENKLAIHLFFIQFIFFLILRFFL